MTAPDVLISGGDDTRQRPPRPTWVGRALAAAVILALVGAVVVRLAGDIRRQQRAERAADRVEAVLRISESGVGAGGTVVVGVQVTGQGQELRVGTPAVRPGVLRVEAVGVPLTVAADRGNEVRLRLHPRCAQARALDRLEIAVPVTPASGRRHVLRVPFPTGPDLVRRACGYLPAAEALTVETPSAVVAGAHLRLALLVHNDSSYPLSLREVVAFGIEAQGVRPPVAFLPGAPPVALQLDLRVTDCGQVRADPAAGSPLILAVADDVGEVTEVVPSFDVIVAQYRSWLQRACAGSG